MRTSLLKALLFTAACFALSGEAFAAYLKVPILRCPAGTLKVIRGMEAHARDTHLTSKCVPMADVNDKTPSDFVPHLPAEVTSWSALMNSDAKGIPTTTDCIVFVPDRINLKGIKLKPQSVVLDRAAAAEEIQTRAPTANLKKMEEMK